MGVSPERNAIAKDRRRRSSIAQRGMISSSRPLLHIELDGPAGVLCMIPIQLTDRDIIVTGGMGAWP